jgi:hypothetical protein
LFELFPSRCASIVVVIALAGSAACNTRTPVLDSDPIPTGPSASGVLPVSQLATIELDHYGMMGGESGRGSVLLNYPAPAGGVDVTFAASDAAVTMTPSVHVPAGAVTAHFAFSTQGVPTDRMVSITASARGRSVATELAVWTVLPNFLALSKSQYNPRASNVRPYTLRITPVNGSLTAACQRNQVFVYATGPDAVGLWFGASPGAPLRTGVYENTTGVGGTANPVLDVSGVQCSGAGRFVVHELELTLNGSVRKFWASFELQCGLFGAVRGDVRVIDAPPAFSGRCTLD